MTAWLKGATSVDSEVCGADKDYKAYFKDLDGHDMTTYIRAENPADAAERCHGIAKQRNWEFIRILEK